MRRNPIAALALSLLGGGILAHAGANLWTHTAPLREEIELPPVVRASQSSIFEPPALVLTIRKRVTGYTSDPAETDDTPFITASQEHVRDGIVATNQLGFGTEVKIPTLFGDRVFVVEDRMHPRYKNSIDVWTGVGPQAKKAAHRIGIQYANVVVLLD